MRFERACVVSPTSVTQESVVQEPTPSESWDYRLPKRLHSPLSKVFYCFTVPVQKGNGILKTHYQQKVFAIRKYVLDGLRRLSTPFEFPEK